MNSEVKAKWISALRSGKYQPTTRFLKKFLENGSIGHCCLGVLCEIYLEEHPEATWKKHGDGCFGFIQIEGAESSAKYLPNDVIEWAGLGERNWQGRTPDGKKSLAVLNDDGVAFKDIADIIEKEF